MVRFRGKIRVGGLLILGSLILGACDSGTAATPTPVGPPVAAGPTATLPSSISSGAGKVMKIGFLTDGGRIDDKGFNQAIWEGVQAAGKTLGAETKYIENLDPGQQTTLIEQLVAGGYNPIVTPSFSIGVSTANAAKKHPDVRFIGVDQFIDPASDAAHLPNYAGVSFEEDKAGYLAGALAAQMTKSKTIGAVLGTDGVPPVWRFGQGYKAGAQAISADVKVELVYHSDVDIGKSFDDPTWGKATAQGLMDKGADVIFAAAGNTGTGALQVCAEQRAAGKAVYAIGVDVDQYDTDTQARPALLSSATKLLAASVKRQIVSIADGTFTGGNVTGEVGLAPFHDFDGQVPAAVKARLAEIDKGLKDGSIKTNVPPVKP